MILMCNTWDGENMYASDDSYLKIPLFWQVKTHKTLTSPNSSFEIFYRQNKAVTCPPDIPYFCQI